MSSTWSAWRSAVHWWAVLAAMLTFVLLCSGGLVTSHGAGMAVPDWPNTFGYNMFLFPLSRWVGGIFYEHTHRLIASGIGLMTVILSVALWRVEPRRWVKIFGGCAVVAVCLQGLLGGLRVVLIKDEIGILHALLAQSFFVAISLLAIVTGRSFVERRWADYEPHPTLRWWALGTTALVCLQLGIGATMRHEHIGLSIPDFPLAYGSWLPDTSSEAMERINSQRLAASEMKTNALQIWIQMAHRIIAFGITAAVLTFFWKARRGPRAIRFWSMVWLAMVCVQIALGAWTIWSNKAADVATAHMALGALTLLVGALLAFRLFYGAQTRRFILPDAPSRRLIQRIA
ncbi:MAG TPA: COX15/CtaA family protein [Terrimicrobiaceae bacterium]